MAMVEDATDTEERMESEVGRCTVEELRCDQGGWCHTEEHREEDALVRKSAMVEAGLPWGRRMRATSCKSNE